MSFKEYNCDACGAQFDSKVAERVEFDIESELTGISSSSEGYSAAAMATKYESLLERAASSLHPTHGLVMRAKSQLIAIYGNSKELPYKVRKSSENLGFILL